MQNGLHIKERMSPTHVWLKTAVCGTAVGGVPTPARVGLLAALLPLQRSRASAAFSGSGEALHIRAHAPRGTPEVPNSPCGPAALVRGLRVQHGECPCVDLRDHCGGMRFALLSKIRGQDLIHQVMPLQVFPMGSWLSFPVCGVPITGQPAVHLAHPLSFECH